MSRADTPLDNIIKAKIKKSGPMALSEYMALCLGHPEHGYYMSRDPFGKEGDFTTAPEISQMFGEMVGAWLIDTWEKLGSPNDVTLLECGPGRGTLMSDILRVARGVPAFIDAVHVVLMETSPVLKQKQGEVLGSFDLKHKVQWVDCTESLSDPYPLLAIGNEFLDALPVDQYVFTEAGWAKKYIDLEKNDAYRICEVYNDKEAQALKKDQPNRLFQPKAGDLLEVSHEQQRINNDLMEIVLNQGGSILWIDYGYKNYGGGDTLQAVKNHGFSDWLNQPGETDLTYHINFGDLVDRALAKNMVVHGPVSQGDYLRRLGIELRAENLKHHATQMQRGDIDASLNRLIGKDEMGDLFKVIAFTKGADIDLSGF